MIRRPTQNARSTRSPRRSPTWSRSSTTTRRQPGALPSIDRPTLEAVVTAASDHGLKTLVHVGTWERLPAMPCARAPAASRTCPRGHIRHAISPTAERGTPPFRPRRARGLRAFHRRARAAGFSAAPSAPRARTTPALFKTPPRGETAGFIEWQRGELARTLLCESTRRRGRSDGHRLRSAPATPVSSRAIPCIASCGCSSRRYSGMGRPRGDDDQRRTSARTRLGHGVGDEGTLVILDASPLDDITNTERIATVVLRGVVVDRSALVPPAP